MFKKETTQEFLERLKDSIENYDPNEYFVSKEELEGDYLIYENISKTITNREMQLIHFLRLSPPHMILRFRDIAKNLCNAYQEFLGLKDSVDRKEREQG